VKDFLNMALLYHTDSFQYIVVIKGKTSAKADVFPIWLRTLNGLFASGGKSLPAGRQANFFFSENFTPLEAISFPSGPNAEF